MIKMHSRARFIILCFIALCFAVLLHIHKQQPIIGVATKSTVHNRKTEPKVTFTTLIESKEKRDREKITEECIGEKLSHYKKKISKKKEGQIPDVIGVGVRKCGTGVYMNFLKKHGCFQFPNFRTYETEYFTNRRRNGIAWYKDLFSPVEVDKLASEKTPHYFYASPPSIPRDIKKDNPSVKIILLLCDPAARAFSCFVHHFGRLQPPASWVPKFEDFVKRILPSVIKGLNSDKEQQKLFALKNWNSEKECFLAGLYSLHINRWMKYYNESQMLIVNGDRVMDNPGKEYQRLQQFLNVPQYFRRQDWVKHDATGHFCLRPPSNRSALYCQDNGKEKARTRSKIASRPSNETMKMLNEFYKPYNQKLVEILGNEFEFGK